MATTEKKLANAYGEIIDAEIEATVASADKDIPEMSAEFRKKMEELIRTGKPNIKKGLSKRGKRILIIAIAAVLALTLTACAVPEIRESIAGFFVKIFSDHVEYSDPEVTKDSIEEEYGLVPIPEGFTVMETFRTDLSLVIKYSDNQQNTIILRQLVDDNYLVMVDSEHGSFSEYELGGNIVRIIFREDGAQAAWIQDGYYFSLVYPSEIDIKTFEEWILSVKEN